MRSLRLAVSVTLGAAAAIFVLPAAWAFVPSGAVAIAVAAVAGALWALLLLRRPPPSLDATAVPRALALVSALATIGAVLAFARLAVFIVAPSQIGYSSIPNSEWEARHSCVSAYYVAARASSTSSDIYADSLYTARNDDPSKPRTPRMMGPFRIDVFEYPPPFLLLPRALRLVTPEFVPFRMLWFAINGAFVLLAMIVVARRLGPAAGTRALLLLPLAWFSLPMLSNMQKGNAQAAVIAASVLAMALFERRRWAAGGVLLAFATVSKLYPGLLIVYLLARREWRAVAWTSALALVFALVTVAVMGRGVYAAFAQHLPGLLGGEAFPAFRNPAAMAINFSIPGLIFKLKLFGVPGMGFVAAKWVGWIYTLVAIGATWALARHPAREDERPLAWLAVLILATLRSPFLPQAYAGFPAMWLLTLVAARLAPTPRTLALTLLAWLGLGIMWPLDWPLDTRWLALLSGVPQLLTIGLAALIVRSGLRREGAGQGSAPPAKAESPAG